MMELTQTLPNTGRIVQRLALGRTLGIALATFVMLLLISSGGFLVAVRTGLVPPLDMHLTLDGRHALVIHNDLPCVPEEPPQLICGGGEWQRELKVTYSAPEGDWVLIAIALPES
jgi:hypothetical protein